MPGGSPAARAAGSHIHGDAPRPRSAAAPPPSSHGASVPFSELFPSIRVISRSAAPATIASTPAPTSSAGPSDCSTAGPADTALQRPTQRQATAELTGPRDRPVQQHGGPGDGSRRTHHGCRDQATEQHRDAATAWPAAARSAEGPPSRTHWCSTIGTKQARCADEQQRLRGSAAGADGRIAVPGLRSGFELVGHRIGALLEHHATLIGQALDELLGVVAGAQGRRVLRALRSGEPGGHHHGVRRSPLLRQQVGVRRAPGSGPRASRQERARGTSAGPLGGRCLGGGAGVDMATCSQMDAAAGDATARDRAEAMDPRAILEG